MNWTKSLWSMAIVGCSACSNEHAEQDLGLADLPISAARIDGSDDRVAATNTKDERLAATFGDVMVEGAALRR